MKTPWSRRRKAVERMGLPMSRARMLWRMLTCRGEAIELPLPPKPRAIHVACYGPSLHDTWHYMVGQDVISVSGAHDFLIERGIVPKYHLELDPRPHKAGMINHPQRETTYILATVCNRNMFAKLAGYNVVKIHAIFGSWFGLQVAMHFVNRAPILTGGNNVGTRAVPLVRSMGYRQIHIHAMDLCVVNGQRWAGPHSSTETVHQLNRHVGNRLFATTVVMNDAADFMVRYFKKTPECRFAVYGDGMLAALLAAPKVMPMQWFNYKGPENAANPA